MSQQPGEHTPSPVPGTNRVIGNISEAAAAVPAFMPASFRKAGVSGEVTVKPHAAGLPHYQPPEHWLGKVAQMLIADHQPPP